MLATAAQNQFAGTDRMVHVQAAPVAPALKRGRASASEEAPAIPETYIGDILGHFGITITPDRPNVQVRLEVTVPGYAQTSSIETYLPRAGTEYEVFPLIEYDFDRLRHQVQPSPATAAFTLYIDGVRVGQERRPIRVRSVYDCPFYASDRKGGWNDLTFMFGAYVNEDHPAIDVILREALSQRIVTGFYGYQRGQQEVLQQAYALWNTLQRRGIKYSSITATSGNSPAVYSQYVRLFEDAITSGQANCVEGSVMFASMLRKIGIDPILVSVPGHMYVGFYLDAEHTNFRFLETTMLGNADRESHLFGLGFNEKSLRTFNEALQYATNRFTNEDQPRMQAGEAQYSALGVAELRAAGIMPIAR